jgi:SAM-dependent methyltransferase
MDRITQDEIARLTDKSSRDPDIVELYRENDFLTAYGKHTDARVKADPQQAIGGDWEFYGAVQRDFLIAQGLRPEDRLLDFGCGTGRLARAIVPCLNAGNYTGIDISAEALAHCRTLSVTEAWALKGPVFVDSFDAQIWPTWPCFDYAWAFSVFIHLPSAIVSETIADIAPRSRNFYFSYVPTDLPDNTRTGLKQFKHPLSFYARVASDLGYSLTEIPWPGRQRILQMVKA